MHRRDAGGEPVAYPLVLVALDEGPTMLAAAAADDDADVGPGDRVVVELRRNGSDSLPTATSA